MDNSAYEGNEANEVQNSFEVSSATMLDILEQEKEKKEEKVAVLGGSDEKPCTDADGAVQRQAQKNDFVLNAENTAKTYEEHGMKRAADAPSTYEQGSNNGLASYVVSLNLAKNGRPFEDAEFFQDVAVSVLQCFGEKGHKMSKLVEEIPLSRNTVAQRTEKSAAFLYSKAKKSIVNCKYFSLCLDESADFDDSSQLIICFRAVDENWHVTEELLNLHYLHKQASGNELIEALRKTVFSFADKSKLTTICTDGARLMQEKCADLISQLKYDGVCVQNLHCNIRPVDLFAKSCMCEKTLKRLISIIKQIRGAHKALPHTELCTFLEELDDELQDTPFNSEVSCLSKAKYINSLFSLKTEVAIFLENEKSTAAKELALLLLNPEFLLHFAFLCDLTSFFAQLSFNPHGKYKYIFDLVPAVDFFKQRILMLEQQFKNCDLRYFPKTAEITTLYNIQEKLVDFYETFHEMKLNFEAHFKDFNNIRHIIALHNNPLTCADDGFDNESKLELQNLQADASVSINDGLEFWRELEERKYPLLKSKIYQLYSMFGSTYVCETALSSMAYIKTQQPDLLSNDHLEDLLRIKQYSSKIDIDELIAFKPN